MPHAGRFREEVKEITVLGITYQNRYINLKRGLPQKLQHSKGQGLVEI